MENARVIRLKAWIKANRRELMASDGLDISPTELGKATKKKPTYWSDVLREGSTKPFADKAARATEEALGMPWLYLEGATDTEPIRALGVMRHPSATSLPITLPALNTANALLHLADLMSQTKGVTAAAVKALLHEFVEHPDQAVEAAQSLDALLTKRQSAA